MSIVVDSQGNSFVSGSTESPDFPFTASFPANPLPGSRIRPAHPDVFVTKLNAAGTTRLYSVLVGGDSSEYDWDLGIDSSGNAFVGGTTRSTNFPTTAGAFLGSLQAGSDSFFFKLNAAGTALVYSTYLGDKDVSSNHRLSVISVDAAGSTLLGYTSTYSALSGFLRRLNASGSAVDFSTSVAEGRYHSGLPAKYLYTLRFNPQETKPRRRCCPLYEVPGQGNRPASPFL